ncbi:MAG: hypothetical protein ACP5IB_07570 [Thermoplasmata archaeon]
MREIHIQAITPVLVGSFFEYIPEARVKTPNMGLYPKNAPNRRGVNFKKRHRVPSSGDKKQKGGKK